MMHDSHMSLGKKCWDIVRENLIYFMRKSWCMALIWVSGKNAEILWEKISATLWESHDAWLSYESREKMMRDHEKNSQITHEKIMIYVSHVSLRKMYWENMREILRYLMRFSLSSWVLTENLTYSHERSWSHMSSHMSDFRKGIADSFSDSDTF